VAVKGWPQGRGARPSLSATQPGLETTTAQGFPVHVVQVCWHL